MRPTPLIAVALVAPAQHSYADAVAEEVTVGTTVASPDSAASQWIADRIAGTWNPDDEWQLDLDVSATRARSTMISANASDAVSTSLSLDIEASEPWSVRMGLGWSPRVRKSSAARIEADESPDGTEMDVVLVSSSWTGSLGASVSYDTAGDGDFETTATLGIRASFFSTLQAVTELDIEPERTQVRSVAVAAGVGETLYQDTDLGLDVELYGYDQDPTAAGYFAIATVDGGALGDGVAVAPMQYVLSPMIAHRFGTIAVTASAGYGNYIHELGHEVTASLRVQTKLALAGDRRVKLYGKLGSAWDVPPEGRPTQSLSLAVGGAYAW